LRRFTAKYGCNYVFDSLINNPVAILASGLSKGVLQPFGFVPYHELTENERMAKAAAEQRQRGDTEKRKVEEEAFNRKIEQFDTLSHPEQEKWLQRALAELPPVLRGSKKAVRSMAIELSGKGL
jgi:hypothetical protein